MALYKDGEIYRTYEEQIDHLTEAHREQLAINKNLSNNINELNIASNLGGYNLVRFSFEKQGTFFKIANKQITVSFIGNIGDFAEITTNDPEDIPAYGYFSAEHTIDIAFAGDFVKNYGTYTVNNVTSGQSSVETIGVVAFTGTSLSDYDANAVKKQLFNIVSDLAYGTRTQYVSFDLNRDGIYSFVFIGTVNNGKDGANVYSTNGTAIENLIQHIKVDDSVLFAEDNTTNLIDPNAVIGDVFIYKGNNQWEKTGNIRGLKGDKGDKGEKGDQGIQGVQGIQGIQGIKGDKGDKGDPGNQGMFIHDSILSNPSELPSFEGAIIGDAYRVINTSGSNVTYDLYFKSVDGTTWSIQPNWGGVKGDKGDKGDPGETGAQGVQGIQGAKGDKGDKGDTGNGCYINGVATDINFTSDPQNQINGKTQIDLLWSGNIKNIDGASITIPNYSNYKYLIVNLNIGGIYNALIVPTLNVKNSFVKKSENSSSIYYFDLVMNNGVLSWGNCGFYSSGDFTAQDRTNTGYFNIFEIRGVK